jgi:hypothetical protein
MKAIVINKKHLTLVSHTNGVVIVEESGCIIDLDFQSLGSIFELADLGNTYTIKDCDEIESLKSNNNELTERIEFLEKQLTNSGDRVTELRSEIIGLTNELDIHRQRISQLNDELNCRDKIIEEKTKRLIELENVEYELNKFRETNTNLQESLESKNSDLIEVTALFKYYRRAFRTFKDYFKPYEKYNLDNSGCNILNSIDKSFIISFREKHIAREAIDELRNCISPMDIFRKYSNDIIEYNIDSMTVYFVEATSPTVIRKFGDNGFIINCRNNREAEIINTLINCNIPVNDVISTYNSYIVSTSIY